MEKDEEEDERQIDRMQMKGGGKRKTLEKKSSAMDERQSHEHRRSLVPSRIARTLRLTCSHRYITKVLICGRRPTLK